MYSNNGIKQLRPGVLIRVADRYADLPVETPRIENNELERIAVIVNENGINAAIEFVERTKQTYRRAVVNQNRLPALTYASLPEYRAGYIGSYLQFKRFLEAIQRDPEAWKTILPL